MSGFLGNFLKRQFDGSIVAKFYEVVIVWLACWQLLEMAI
jgi:hypothetical protein